MLGNSKDLLSHPQKLSTLVGPDRFGSCKAELYVDFRSSSDGLSGVTLYLNNPCEEKGVITSIEIRVSATDTNVMYLVLNQSFFSSKL